MSIRVPQGEEQHVKCHVEHGGNHSAHPVPSGEPGVSLEGVVTLGGSEARIRERRADLWLWGAWVICNKALSQERPWCIRVSGGPSWVLLTLLLFLSSGFVSFAARRRRRRQHQLWGAQVRYLGRGWGWEGLCLGCRVPLVSLCTYMRG